MIVCGKLEQDKVTRMVNAISDACKEQDCILTGGETSEQPGVIPEGTYILSSSIVGIVDKPKIIDGSSINPGDDVIAVASSGLHTNGYSLVRLLLDKYPAFKEDEYFINSILEPHRCYYKTIRQLYPVIKGMAHITGGGIKENLDRILPKNVNALIDLEKIKLLPIFDIIREIRESSR